jgi:hypothetical protein
MTAARMRSICLPLVFVILGTVVSPAASRRLSPGEEPVAGQQTNTQTPPVVMTAEQDHQRMMDVLHITALREGANGSNPDAPNAANYDEAKANPYPNLPDPLTLKNAGKVTTAQMWWNQRRPEIVEDFDREVYGRIPKVTPKVNWEVKSKTTEMNGTVLVITKQLVGHVDNSSYPFINVDIQLTLTTPVNAEGPAPVIMEFGFVRGAGRAPGGPPPVAPQTARIVPGAAPPNPATGTVAAAPQTMRINPGAGGANPGGASGATTGPGGPASASTASAGAGGREPASAPAGNPLTVVPIAPSWQQQVLAKGWGYAVIIPTTIQADNGQGLTQGIIGLVNKGQPRKVDDWGALRAWAWGASRALDYFETDSSVDAKQVGIEGLSRYGKAALVTMAYDQRFAIGFIASSGEGGAKVHRRNAGELVENLASTGGYHWMAGNFLKYAGPLSSNDLPVDSHELVALCAPRPVFISCGAFKGDAWVDAKGMFLAAVGAGPVYKLLGKRDLGTTEFPPIETALIDGEIAFRQHSGGHTTVPNWPTFITFASRYLRGPAQRSARAEDKGR